MKLNQSTVFVALIVAAMVTAPLAASQQSEEIKGEVVAVQQQTQNQATEQIVTVRTRRGEEKQIRLRDGSGDNCVQIGDQVKARISRSSAQGAGQVQSMKVKRNGEMYGYSNQSGQLVRIQQRLRDGSGAGRQAHRQGGSGGNNCGVGTGNRSGGRGRGSGGV